MLVIECICTQTPQTLAVSLWDFGCEIWNSTCQTVRFYPWKYVSCHLRIHRYLHIPAARLNSQEALALIPTVLLRVWPHGLIATSTLMIWKCYGEVTVKRFLVTVICILIAHMAYNAFRAGLNTNIVSYPLHITHDYTIDFFVSIG